MRKWIDRLVYALGAVLWPWCAGIFMGLEDSLPNALVVVVLLGWSFVAWWKFFKWLRNLPGER